MEPPTSLAAKPLRDEKVKVFERCHPLDVRRWCAASTTVIARSRAWPRLGTETFVALTGRGRQLAVGRGAVLPAHRQGPGGEPAGRDARLPEADRCGCSRTRERRSGSRRGNELVIDFADPGSIAAHVPGQGARSDDASGRGQMTFRYEDSFCAANDLEGYERLILDAMLGDQALFTRSDGIERLWEISTPLLEHPPPVEPYAPARGARPSVQKLVAPYRWHLPT